jgi:hypothetical protein
MPGKQRAAGGAPPSCRSPFQGAPPALVGGFFHFSAWRFAGGVFLSANAFVGQSRLRCPNYLYLTTTLFSYSHSGHWNVRRS